ncbi:ADP-ribosylglycohydrolase family protein [Acinetobacter pollinis]|uniref:ADP-ribosylglycohydrolase family protein n=1 Tax=Acinetobacter pollinis TaxID=2605270 RepID=A0ABU6DUM7_9GAMM|nr:ADP-ribosylglycohydrolase family protein [Acinetobacter pollinis]
MKNKTYGAIFGLLIGDAVGVPYEFKDASQIDLSSIDIHPKNLKNKTYSHIPFGTWSDDGAQSLILLSSLLDNQKLDLIDILNRLVKWLDDGYMSINNNTFDVGIQTALAINKYKRFGILEIEEIPNEFENGNGSLMRCLPLVLWHQGSNEDLVSLAHQQSLITHPHIRSQVCCAWYCLIARNIFLSQDITSAIEHAKETIQIIYTQENNHDALNELEKNVFSYDLNDCHGSGYVVDSLMTSLLCLQEDSYSNVIKKAVSFGNDTDTTACIAGGLAGIRFGMNGIPSDWILKLLGHEIIDPLLLKLSDHILQNCH